MSGEMILVIDSTQENIEFVVKQVLEPNKFRVLTALSSSDGLEIVLSHEPDLILLDYNMAIDGTPDILKNIHAKGLNIPVIMIISQTAAKITSNIFRLGVHDFFVSPFSPEELLQSIQKQLGENTLVMENEYLMTQVTRANQELYDRLDELDSLHKIGQSVISLASINSLLLRVVDVAVDLTHAEQGYISLIQGDKLICRVKRFAGKEKSEKVSYTIDNAIAAQLVKSGKLLIADQERLRMIGADDITAAMYAPMMLGQKVIGVVGVENISQDARGFSQHNSVVLSTICDYVAIAISYSHNYEKLKLMKAQLKQGQGEVTEETKIQPDTQSHKVIVPAQTKPQRQEISALCVDIVGHAAWSETAPPEAVVDTLNHYINLAIGVVQAWEGTLTDFNGDSLVAIFNAPVSQADHVHRASDAALALMKVSKEITSLYGHDLQYRVGVYIGQAIVGFVGSEDTQNYTALGETVNLAKRLQKYAAPGQILVEEGIIKRLGHLAQSRPVGDIIVTGHKQKIFVYELIGLHYPASM